MNTHSCLGAKQLRRERNSRWIEMSGPQKWRMIAAGVLLALSGAIGTITAQQATPPRPAPTAALVQQGSRFINAKAIFIVRHAEYEGKPENKKPTTPLSQAGENRAIELSHVLRNVGITHIITSDTQRTKTTASIVAAPLNLTPTILADANNIPDYLARNANSTNVFLIVYNHSAFSNILDNLGIDTKHLGFDPKPEEEEFDRIYCVIPEAPSKNSPRLLLLRYGRPFERRN